MVRTYSSIIILSIFLLLPRTSEAFTAEALTRAIHIFFPNTPEMVEVARCESGLHQYTSSGSTLRGGLGNKMIGLFQLHETYHRAPARARGYDIDTLLGNLAYARDLHRSEGLVPWNASKHCWRNSVTSATSEVVAATPALRKTLRYGSRDSEVAVMQQVLQKTGHFTTELGTEAGYFGVRTYIALIQFQCDNSIACLQKPNMRGGVGVVDIETREVINKLAAEMF